jgi:hypothetical protein
MSVGHILWLLFVDFMKLGAIMVSYFTGQDIIKNGDKPRSNKRLIFLVLKVVGMGLILAIWLGNTGNDSSKKVSDESVEFFFLISLPCIIGIVAKAKEQ